MPEPSEDYYWDRDAGGDYLLKIPHQAMDAAITLVKHAAGCSDSVATRVVKAHAMAMVIVGLEIYLRTPPSKIKESVRLAQKELND